MADVLIKNGMLITMDPARRVIERGAVAIEKGKISAVGPTRQVEKAHRARKVIDARGMVVMPGLINTFVNSGANMVKNIAEHASGVAWRHLMDHILLRSVTEKFYHVSGELMALEHLKFGTTCHLSKFGSSPRADDPAYAGAHMEGIANIGIRSVTGVGPFRWPFPEVCSSWSNGKKTDRIVTMEQSFRVVEKLIQKYNGAHGGRTSVWIGLARLLAPAKVDPMFNPRIQKYSRKQANFVKQLMKEYGVGMRVNAYGEAINWAHEVLEILGPKVVLAHATALTEKSIRYLADTDTKVSHCPTARRMYMYDSTCPVVELIDAGVTVSLGTDYTGQDRTGDLFKDMKAAFLHQRQRFCDPSVLPPGKVLEMATIDGARALGMDHLVGSLEPGKHADIILIDMEQPHLKPLWMIPQRVAYQVTGHDVDTVLVDGKILMEGRRVKSVNEKRVLREAQQEGERMVERSGADPLMGIPDGFWKKSRY